MASLYSYAYADGTDTSYREPQTDQTTSTTFSPPPGYYVDACDETDDPADCKEEPEEDVERYFGTVPLPPLTLRLTKRKPLQEPSSYG